MKIEKLFASLHHRLYGIRYKLLIDIYLYPYYKAEIDMITEKIFKYPNTELIKLTSYYLDEIQTLIDFWIKPLPSDFENVINNYSVDEVLEARQLYDEIPFANMALIHYYPDIYDELLYYKNHINAIKFELNSLKKNQEKHIIKKDNSKFDLTNTLSFGLKKTKEKELSEICSKLNHDINFIDCDRSSIEIMSVFKSTDLTKVDSKIYIGCESTQFRYIIDKLQGSFFTNLTLVNIEKAGLFYSKGGTRIKQINLSRSKIVNPKNYDLIDKIFKDSQ